jgi:tetratricopeptide (TPR) repeat protein
MSTWKCLSEGDTPRGRLRSLLGSLAFALTLSPAAMVADRGEAAILPPDAAARSFEAGREAVRRGDYAAGVRRLEEALATGHTRPEEHLGTTRNFVDRYDPDYWLGVAYMELGQKEKARAHLLRSKANGVIARWPEFSDLVTRLASLQERPPEPTKMPEEPQRTPPMPTPPATPTARPLPIPPLQTPVPMLADQQPSPAPAAHARLDAVELSALLTLLSRGEWRAFERDLARARARVPDALEPALLDAVACGSRYLLEGKKDGTLLARARRSLAEYRRRGGPKRAEKLFLSPALEAVF